ncbi:MAG: IS30 family transposase [Pseudohongiellaceae bacterium]
MPKGYSHLTCQERCQIYGYFASGMNHTEIAALLGRSSRTIGRELERNSVGGEYCPEVADGKAKERRIAASLVPRKMTPKLWGYIESRLKEGHSPDQLVGYAKRYRLPTVSPTLIYGHIRKDKAAGGELFKCLRRRGKKPNWRGGRRSGRGQIPDRVDISERDPVVEEKSRLGDFEVDTVIGKGHSGALVSLVCRHSKYCFLRLVDRRTADEVTDAIIGSLLPHAAYLHTMTSDNGKEFAAHKEVSKALGLQFYFATPYHSWERGLNEHTNGLVREYFPKGTDFRRVADAAVMAIQDRLNKRPRKVLGYRTPEQAFTEAAAEVQRFITYH